MKKLEKEAVLKERMILISAVSFFICILPYILHLAINGIQPRGVAEFGTMSQTVCVEVGEQKECIQIETYLVGALARNSEVAYKDETLKAIAIILRSNAVSSVLHEKTLARESFYTDEELRILWGKEYEANIQRYQNVVTTTEGIVLFYEGEIVEVPFHKLSSGITRDSEVWETPLPYIRSVESAEDMYANGYYSTREIRGESLGEDFEVLASDSRGYALLVRIKGTEISGEDFCAYYALPSACFEYDYKEGVYIFYIRGCGHGFGLSLYGANALALKGWSFAEILEYYYPGIEIRKENRSDISA
ncbi:MAG: hypothetical protein IJ397_00210 [Lachnospiraceae bacterium]|nr:hypothetical protein [Lachnospiraceae bacterium]